MTHLSGGMAYPQPTTATVPSSAPPIKLGTRARDASGNEFVYVDFQAAMVEGELCAISSTFTADDATTASVGLVGMVCASVSSDTCGWVQIYGTGKALGSSLLIIGPVGLSDVTSPGYSILLPYTTALTQVVGIYVTAGSTATSASSTEASSVGTVAGTSMLGGLVTVQLNYPFISGGIQATESS